MAQRPPHPQFPDLAAHVAAVREAKPCAQVLQEVYVPQDPRLFDTLLGANVIQHWTGAVGILAVNDLPCRRPLSSHYSTTAITV